MFKNRRVRALTIGIFTGITVAVVTYFSLNFFLTVVLTAVPVYIVAKLVQDAGQRAENKIAKEESSRQVK